MVKCNNEKVPARLHTDNREVNPVFQSEEILYRRFKLTYPSEECTDGIHLSATNFPLSSEGDSYNRGLYCVSPEDALINTDSERQNFPEHGVFEVSVQVVQSLEFIGDNVNDTFNLSIIHQPEPCMYPHTIIVISKNGNPYINKFIKKARLKFKGELTLSATKCNLDRNLLPK